LIQNVGHVMLTKSKSYAMSAVELCLSQGNTTNLFNLFNHLKTHHKLQYDKDTKAKKISKWLLT